MFPLHEVATADMSPVFRATAITERMQLVEEVIKTFVKDRAVRIIDPLGRSRDVKDGACRIGLRPRCGGFDRSRRPGERLVRSFSMQNERWEKQGERGQMKRSKHKGIVSAYP